MIVYKFNDVFVHIEETLKELYGDNPKYEHTVIILGYNVLPSLAFLREQYPGYKLIVYQLEQLFVGSSWVNKKCYNNLYAADEIWDYDEGNVHWMRKHYKLNAKFKPLVYTHSLRRIPPIEEYKCDIDVLFYGYLHERRAKLLINLHHIAGSKMKIFDLYGVWDKELDTYIQRSKIILNVHGKPDSRQEQPRLYYPVINGRCVLSEKTATNYIGNAILEAPYEKLLDTIVQLIKTGAWLNIANQASERYRSQSKKYGTLIND